MTTRDFGDVTGYGISVYAPEKNKMLGGQPDARALQFFLDSNVVPLELIGDGLLPPDIDGNRRRQDHVSTPIVGSQPGAVLCLSGRSSDRAIAANLRLSPLSILRHLTPTQNPFTLQWSGNRTKSILPLVTPPVTIASRPASPFAYTVFMHYTLRECVMHA